MYNILLLKRVGIGGRLLLAFVLISSISLLVSFLSTNTYLQLSEKLYLLKQQDIPGLDAAARLNDKSRLIVTKAPLLVTATSNVARQQAMNELESAIEDMDSLMQNLADYDRYFRELIAQIHNSLVLLNQSVARRKQIHQELLLVSNQISPRFDELITYLETNNPNLSQTAQQSIVNQLYYFAGFVEKVKNDATFHDLDNTILRLEKAGVMIESELMGSFKGHKTAEKQRKFAEFLILGTRQGQLFLLKNEQLDLQYQQSFLLQNSQNHINQLASQINLYSDSTNSRISTSLQRAIDSINRSIKSILLLSALSLLVAGAISWFYVQRNVLQRILELQDNMRAIASAKLNTRIRIVGNDEVSSMARDLKHFQRTAIEVEQTNTRLAAQIEERIIAEKQLKTAQTELIQAGKLAALGQLSVGITHEINQPLTAIASHLHSAGLRLKKSQFSEVEQNHEKIKKLLKKVAVITGHLKSFAREAGSEILPVDVNKVICDAIELMDSRLKADECLVKYTALTQPLCVLAEPIRLEQVLINLISNGIDAIKRAPLRELSIEVQAKGSHVWIEVRDTGVGIEPDQLEYLFDPFYTKKEIGEGLGLGLSISYNIVQDFGGQIKVTSQLGQGSCFILVLRMAQSNE
jgi:two-component system C4-dicarboxylate transport sensor histidine kinase DctB